MKFSRTLICLLLGMAGLLSITPAQAWWNKDWTYRKKITIDTDTTGVAITDPIGTATVLVRLHDGNFGFDGAKPDGSDIRFVAEDDKTLLPSHIEKFDSLVNQAFVWVKVPDLKPGTKTVVYLYTGNAKAPVVDDSKDAYDPDTQLVYHFDGSSLTHDSSGNGNDAKTGGTADPASAIGGGVRFSGGTPMTIPASPSFAWTAGGSLTWSAWINFPANQPGAVLFSRQDGGSTFEIGVDNGIPYVAVNNQRSTATGAALAVNSWKHLTVIASGAQISVLVDGAPYAALAASLPTLNSAAYLGGDNAGGTGFNGGVDELEISKVARPAGFLKLTTVNQGPDADSAGKLLTLGPNEEASNWMSWFTLGYFGVILNSVTTDGWVVIGVLIIMAILSWRVNISKLQYLNVQRDANAAFLEVWQQVGTDLTVLEDADNFKTFGGRITEEDQELIHESALYRIYHIGAEEIRKRLVASQGGGTLITAQSIEAIRASLAGAFELECEELDSGLVVMKVAIAGGPFIGLLGTVIGVMITFAAIAVAGDVNVNAIAPGISAAMVATAAGLLVAIPAMFGYNYLVSRIKQTKTKLRVFIDEFITKLAEFHHHRSSPNPRGEATYVDAR